MYFSIEHESNTRIRISLGKGRLSSGEAEVLRYAIGSISGVRSVTVYQATCGVAITYEEGARERILQKITAFRQENLALMGSTETKRIDLEEMKKRKLDPAVKQKLRTRIVIEALADMVMPAPVQLGYHVYQFLTLKDI